MDEINKETLDKIKYLINKKKKTETMCEALGLKEYELIGLVKMLHEQGEPYDYIDGEFIKLKKPPMQSDVYQIPNNLETLQLCLISDTHLCSKYDRLDILRYIYDECEKRGIQYVLHSGDFTDGRSNRPEQVYELREPSYEGQVQYCVEKYPEFSGQTFVIQGN